MRGFILKVVKIDRKFEPLDDDLTKHNILMSMYLI